MKNFFILAILLLFPLISYSQKAKIITSDNEIVTNISAFSNNELFTESGNFKFSSILKIIFEKDTDRSQYLAEKLKDAFPIEFADGSDFGTITEKAQNKGEPNLTGQTKTDSGDYLIKASRSGLISIGIGLATAGATVLSGGTIPAIAIIGGIGSLGFLIDAWANIGAAGRARKKELKEEKNPK